MANPNLTDVARDIQTTGKVAKILAKSMSRSSLTRMAQDSIMQFPLLISSSIDTDEIIIMARALERQYATLMASVMSLNNGVDINKYGSLADYLKVFHSNKDIPTNITAATSMIIESLVTTPSTDPKLKELALECWNITKDMLDMESLNDTYQPFIRTARLIQDRLNSMKESTPATEAVDFKNLNRAASKYEDSGYGGINPASSITRDRVDKNGKVMTDPSGKTLKEKIDFKGTQNPNMAPVIAKDKLSGLEPTMIDVTFLLHGGEGNNSQWQQRVTLGVKSMIRMVRSDLMVSNMAEASKNSNAIFKFIQWTKGEYKATDALFNASELKDSATTSTKDTSRWWKALRRRRSINGISKFFNNKVLPSTTIIMTTYEVAQVAQLTGVNLQEVYNAAKLVDKYYLLGFGVYDTETNILSMLFDGEADFSDITMSSLKSNNVGKDADLTNDKNARQLMGKR